MVKYDPTVIYAFAQRLYSRAQLVIMLATVLGAIIGAFIGYVLSGKENTGLVAGAVILGVIGLLVGAEWAFWLKLRAQMALCQVKIEQNTRMLLEQFPGGTPRRENHLMPEGDTARMRVRQPTAPTE